jgi:hypothetical protein
VVRLRIMAGERYALNHHRLRWRPRSITSPSAALMTTLAKGIGSNPRPASVSVTPTFQLGDHHIDNLHEASSLGGFIDHVVPSASEPQRPASATRSRVPGPRGAAGDGIDVHQGTGSGVKLSLDADHKQTETGRGDQQQQTRDDDGKTQALHYCQSGRSSIVPGNSRGCNPRLQGGVILDDTFNLFLRTTTKNHH